MVPIVHPPENMSEYDNGWDNIDRREPKITLSQCHCVHHTSHTDWMGANPGLRGGKPETKRMTYDTAWTWLFFVAAQYVPERRELILLLRVVGSERALV